MTLPISIVQLAFLQWGLEAKVEKTTGNKNSKTPQDYFGISKTEESVENLRRKLIGTYNGHKQNKA